MFPTLMNWHSKLIFFLSVVLDDKFDFVQFGDWDPLGRSVSESTGEIDAHFPL